MVSLPLLGALGLVGLLSLLVSPRVRTADAFFRGLSDSGAAPGLWTLVLSQVTTWIFARSLLNAALLGYAFGITGTAAYTIYYASFLTGAAIVDRIRFRRGHASVHDYLRAEFGGAGTLCYNVVIVLRLLSEVFANLLAVGLIFGPAGSNGYVAAIAVTAATTLAYSALGGLRASLTTDVVQMAAFAGLMLVLAGALVLHPAFDAGAVLSDVGARDNPGWVLMAVAALQVWGYPLHDPVMMDRGFLADRRTTRRSFLHAFWISALCIFAFGLLGVFAGQAKLPGEDMNAALLRLLGEPLMTVLWLAVIVSAASTLDSALASAAKLAVVDLRLAAPTVAAGRAAMTAFALGGIALLFLGSKDLFDAVAISGTASLYLAPVVILGLLLGWRAPAWSYVTSFGVAMSGAILYMLESAGRIGWIGAISGYSHSYSKLLVVTVTVLAAGLAAFALGAWHLRRTDSVGR